MTEARTLRRHRAYFTGWAQAFGHHDLLRDTPQGLRWLVGEMQLGLILDPSVRTRLRGGEEQHLGGLLADNLRSPAAVRSLYRLGQTATRSSLTPSALVDVGSETLRLGRLTLRHCPDGLMDRLRALLRARDDLHLYETYHLMYPSGTRILTLSRRAPLGLIYRELSPAVIRLAPIATPAAAPLLKAACA